MRATTSDEKIGRRWLRIEQIKGKLSPRRKHRKKVRRLRQRQRRKKLARRHARSERRLPPQRTRSFLKMRGSGLGAKFAAIWKPRMDGSGWSRTVLVGSRRERFRAIPRGVTTDC